MIDKILVLDYQSLGLNNTILETNDMTITKLAQALFEQCLVDETIYSFGALLENRIDFIKKKHGGKLDEFVDHVATNIDPTKNKKYTEWLVDRHMKGEDIHAPDVKESLAFFDKAKSDVHDTNIKNHTLDSMRDVAHLVKTSPATKKESGKLEEIYNEDGVHGFKVPDAETSKKIYGHGQRFSTTWCTAANSASNMFDHYDGGKYTMHFPNNEFLQLHHQSGQLKDPSNTDIEVHNDPRYSNYSYHIERFIRHTQELERADSSMAHRHFGIDRESYKDLWDQYHTADDYTGKQIALEGIAKHISKQPITEEQFKIGLDHPRVSREMAKNHRLSEDQLRQAIGPGVHDAGKIHPDILGNPAIKGKLLDDIFHAHINTEDGYHLYKIDRLKNLQDKHINELAKKINSIDGPSRGAYDDGLHNVLDSDYKPKLSKETIDEIHKTNPKSSTLMLKVGTKQELPEPHRTNAIDMLRHGMRNALPSTTRGMQPFDDHNTLSSHEIHRLIDVVQDKITSKNVASNFFYGVGQLPKLKNFDSTHSSRIRDLVNHAHDAYLSATVMSEPKMTTPDVESILEHRKNDSGTLGDTHFSEYLSRRDANPEFIKNVMHAVYGQRASLSNKLNSVGYYSHRNMPDSEVENRDAAPYIAMHVNNHPRLKPEHLTKLIDSLHAWTEHERASPSSSALKEILNHPSANTSHFHKVLDHFGGDWMNRDMVSSHPRTPPSVHDRISKEWK